MGYKNNYVLTSLNVPFVFIMIYNEIHKTVQKEDDI